MGFNMKALQQMQNKMMKMQEELQNSTFEGTSGGGAVKISMTGKFEVTSPNGERYFVTTQPGHSIISLEWAGSEPNLQPFLVRKVAQPIATEGRSKRSAAA